MVRSADAYRHGEDSATGVVTVTGRNRLPSDVVNELMSVLAEQPRLVACDLTGMAASSRTMGDLFDPVAPYLSNWPGTLVVACLRRPAGPAQILLAGIAGRLLVHERCEDGLDEAYRLLQPLQHTMTYLAPVPTAAGEARSFTIATLRDWRLPMLLGPASLVVSELVTDSLVDARTVLGLSLSRCEDRLRIAVHDHGGGRPALPVGDAFDETLEGRGLLVVQALTRSWGVFPSRTQGKTVWALIDAPGPRSRPLSIAAEPAAGAATQVTRSDLGEPFRREK